MPTPDREMFLQAMAKLMEQPDIVAPKPGPLFTEIMDFHSCLSSSIISVDDRVSIPRSRQWERRLAVDLPPITSFAITGRTFDSYVIDDPIPTLTLDDLRIAQQVLINVGRFNHQFIGDQTCVNNAKSAHLRCAINPCGPCEGCPDYQPGVGGGGGAL